MDEAVAQFTALTSTEPDVATQYLNLADGNLEAAVQLFFEGGLDVGGSGAQPAPSAPPVPSSTRPTSRGPPRHYTEDEHGTIHIDSDDEDMPDADDGNAATGTARQSSNINADVEDDAAMARRLQEEMYAGGDGGAAEGVRAPMARTTETLVGPAADWGTDAGDMNTSIAEQLLNRERARMNRPGIFNQRPQGSIWDEEGGVDSPARRRYLSRATGGASEQSSKSSSLAEMYRPPYEIMNDIPWDNARDKGKDEEKWLLVDVQNRSVFDCQILNRDIWKNPSVQETVREHFIFLQYMKDDPRGAQYIQYYFQAHEIDDAYPHIAIVDPRTGEQVKTWSGSPVPTASDFVMQLYEFLDRYSLKVNARNPVANRKPPEKKAVERMSEEEQMEMAIKNSMATGGEEGTTHSDPDELTRETGKGKEKAVDLTDEEPQARATNGDTKAASPFAQISSSNAHTEPANDPSTTTRIQFRYSGGRIVRRFALSDPVRRLYEWLKASPLEGKEGQEFELRFSGQDLIEQLDTSIQDAGLKNASVMVEFVDE